MNHCKKKTPRKKKNQVDNIGDEIMEKVQHNIVSVNTIPAPDNRPVPTKSRFLLASTSVAISHRPRSLLQLASALRPKSQGLRKSTYHRTNGTIRRYLIVLVPGMVASLRLWTSWRKDGGRWNRGVVDVYDSCTCSLVNFLPLECLLDGFLVFGYGYCEEIVGHY